MSRRHRRATHRRATGAVSAIYYLLIAFRFLGRTIPFTIIIGGGTLVLAGIANVVLPTWLIISAFVVGFALDVRLIVYRTNRGM